MHPAHETARIAIVGGGISGLAAAYELASEAERGRKIEAHLFEAAPRLGGVIFTDVVDGCAIETGPDSFLSEKPETLQLASELGLADEVIGSNDGERRTYIVHRGRLVPLPDGLQFLVPTRLLPMATTPLVPFGEKLKMLREWFYKPRAVPDESVSEFVTRHFGRGMVENIADPLLSGVYGGDSTQLSIRATLPRFAQMEEKHGSLIRAVLNARAMMRKAAKQGAPRPLFSAMRGGLSQLTEALLARLQPGVVHCATPVMSIESRTVGCTCRYSLGAGRGAFPEFDALILAMPAHASARLLAPLDDALARPLAAIPYSSSMTVALGYPAEVRAKLPPGFGFLVPRKEGRQMLACTFVHTKFPQRVPAHRALLRCFAGGAGNEAVLQAGDVEVSEIMRRELRDLIGLRDEPLFVRVYRWPQAMAQYTVGHHERIAAIRTRLAQHPGLFLAGNWESGIGISDCIRTGRAAASAALKSLETP